MPPKRKMKMESRFTHDEIMMILSAKMDLEKGDFSVAVSNGRVCFYRKGYPETVVCHYSKGENGIWLFFMDGVDGIDSRDLFRIVSFISNVICIDFDPVDVGDILGLITGGSGGEKFEQIEQRRN